MAEQITGLRRPTQGRALTSASLVQRCGDHRCPPTGCGSHEQDDTLFRSAHGVPVSSLDSARDMTRTAGQALPSMLARTMSMRLGHDFSHVRIHEDARAAASAAYYASHAYTFGSHIMFGAGQYQPGTESGQRLLMHELTHVIQADHGESSATGISSPSDASEQEASRVAAAGGIGDLAPARAPAAIQRQAVPGTPPAPAPASSALAPHVPTEKWSQTLEAAYRAQGDYRRAAAIRRCREEGGRACDLVLTQREVTALYDASQQAKGDAQQVRNYATRLLPVLGLAGPIGNLPVPTVPVPSVPPPSTVLGAGGGAGAVEAAGVSGGAVAATGALAIVAICVVAGIQLWELATFQHELESRGFIILDDALAVCIKGCHTSPVPLQGFREFPRPLPERGFPSSRLAPADEEALRRWLDEAPAPRLRPGDTDVEDEDRRGCRGTATYPRGGNTCHDQFATSVSGVTREWLVTTPFGLSESFDARSHDGRTLYEMKTGYGFLGIRNPTPRQRVMIDAVRERWQAQAALQQLVAELCGYDLVWYFTNEAARAFADGIIQARTVRVPFRCDADGERGR